MSTEPSTTREGESIQMRIATIIQQGYTSRATSDETAGRVLEELTRVADEWGAKLHIWPTPASKRPRP